MATDRKTKSLPECGDPAAPEDWRASAPVRVRRFPLWRRPRSCGGLTQPEPSHLGMVGAGSGAPSPPLASDGKEPARAYPPEARAFSCLDLAISRHQSGRRGVRQNAPAGARRGTRTHPHGSANVNVGPKPEDRRLCPRGRIVAESSSSPFGRWARKADVRRRADLRLKAGAARLGWAAWPPIRAAHRVPGTSPGPTG